MVIQGTLYSLGESPRVALSGPSALGARFTKVELTKQGFKVNPGLPKPLPFSQVYSVPRTPSQAEKEGL